MTEFYRKIGYVVLYVYDHDIIMYGKQSRTPITYNVYIYVYI